MKNQLPASAELGGIGSFFKKIGAIALPLAGTIAAPFTGGATLALIGAGGSIGGGLLSSTGATGGAAKGTAAITAYGEQVIAGINSLVGQLTPDNAAQIAQTADALTNSLSDSSKVYQAKKGKDAAALASAKEQANAAAAQIKRLAGQTARQAAQGQQRQQTGATGTQQSGGFFSQNANANGGAEFDTKTILLFGGAALALIFLLKR